MSLLWYHMYSPQIWISHHRNSLLSSDAVWHIWVLLSLIQVMLCCRRYNAITRNIEEYIFYTNLLKIEAVQFKKAIRKYGLESDNHYVQTSK